MEFQLVITRGRSSNQVLRLTEGVTTVGRQTDCQLRIVSSQVSRRHCQIFEKGGHLLVKDLGSSNGTFVNGKKIQDQRVLEPGDELTVGQVKFRIERIGTTSRPGDTAVPAEAEAMTIGADDVFDIEFDDDTTTSPPMPKPSPTAQTGSAAKPKAAKPAPAPPKPEPATEELGEEAVAEFLLDLDIEEEEE